MSLNGYPMAHLQSPSSLDLFIYISAWTLDLKDLDTAMSDVSFHLPALLSQWYYSYTELCPGSVLQRPCAQHKLTKFTNTLFSSQFWSPIHNKVAFSTPQKDGSLTWVAERKFVGNVCRETHTKTHFQPFFQFPQQHRSIEHKKLFNKCDVNCTTVLYLLQPVDQEENYWSKGVHKCYMQVLQNNIVMEIRHILQCRTTGRPEHNINKANE